MNKRTVAAGTFKAECLGLIDRVAQTRESFIVTKHGRPVVEIIPVKNHATRPLRRSVTVIGDIVAPILDSWEMEK
jgi:prevent-host-death family protein